MAEKEKIREVFLEIKKFKDTLIVVEGEKDKKALMNLGFTNLFALNQTDKSISEKIEQIEVLSDDGEISILTDFDKTGIELHNRIKEELSVRNVRINENLRCLIKELRVSHIEGLDSFIINSIKN